MTWSELQTFSQQWMLGDISSIAGLLVAISGFFVTIKNVLKTRKVSETSAKAVTKVREDLTRMKTVSDFSAAVASMEDIKRLHRDQAWQLLPERYSALRRSLISIRSSDSALTAGDNKQIQAAIAQLGELERAVDEQVQQTGQDIDIAETNAMLSKQIDRLNAVLFRIRQDIGDRP